MVKAPTNFPIDLGTRKIIRGKSTHVLNIPYIAIKTGGWGYGDLVRIFMNTRGEMMIIREG